MGREHIAKELHRRLPDSKLIPIVGLLNKGVLAAAGEAVGFVFPQYLPGATSMPSCCSNETKSNIAQLSANLPPPLCIIVISEISKVFPVG